VTLELLLHRLDTGAVFLALEGRLLQIGGGVEAEGLGLAATVKLLSVKWFDGHVRISLLLQEKDSQNLAGKEPAGIGSQRHGPEPSLGGR
jgi:hypothetical protein